jgi:CheY-like chemotaxis protein/HPt (histidine-containing phosphotransfer) domain-containing protein
LRQVLLNLAGNAIKFTRQGEVVVGTSTVSEDETKAVLRFTVRDTGIGIPADKQHLLFTTFGQVDASTTRYYDGTGLGLAICKQLVELMGGKIGVNSKEGEGSEFWFTLPFAKQLEAQTAERVLPEISGARVLVIDGSSSREKLAEQLKSFGVEAATAEDGSSALHCLRQAVQEGKPFQAALLDMMMRGTDGETLGRSILADEVLRTTALIMMTSIGRKGDAHRLEGIGFAAYLVKPLTESDLFDCLSAVLTGNKPAARRSLITRHSLREARHSQARILLVEDNPTNQEVAGKILQRLGWHADIADNGRQALEALANQPYDLVLMDIQMPDMDGCEATRQIRDPQSSVLKHDIPVIALTAHSVSADAENCFCAGMSDYVTKPIDPEVLANVVERWLTLKVHQPAAQRAGLPVRPCAAEPKPLRVFNSELLLRRMMGDEALARDVVSVFLGDLPGLLASLQERIGQKDLASIWKQAHRLKGSAGNVGGEMLQKAALEMEAAGKAGDIAAVDGCAVEVKLQAHRLQVALQSWTN